MQERALIGRIALATLILFAASSALFAGGGSQATGAKTIVFATDATWPPMEFVDENANLVGFDIDLVNAIAEAAGFEAKFEVVAWDGIFAGLANGQYDAIVSSVTITDERKERFDFTNPYLQSGQILVVPVASPDSTSLASLDGQRVGAQTGTAGAFEIEKLPNVQLAEYPEIGLALNDMVNGNLAGAVLDLPVAADYALQNADFAGKIKIVGSVMTAENLGIVVAKGDSELLALLNDGLAKITASGLLEQLKEKWSLK